MGGVGFVFAEDEELEDWYRRDLRFWGRGCGRRRRSRRGGCDARIGGGDGQPKRERGGGGASIDGEDDEFHGADRWS